MFACEGGTLQEDGTYVRESVFDSSKVEVTPFRNLMDALYYVATAVLGSVAFGPTTPMGRITAVFLTFAVNTMYAMFLAVVGGSYMEHLFTINQKHWDFQAKASKQMIELEQRIEKLTRRLVDEQLKNEISQKEAKKNMENILHILHKVHGSQFDITPEPENYDNLRSHEEHYEQI